MAQWSKTYSAIDGLNSGNEFTVNDYPTPQAFNIALNNTVANHDEIDDIKDGTTAVTKVKFERNIASAWAFFGLVGENDVLSGETTLTFTNHIKVDKDTGELWVGDDISFYSNNLSQRVSLDALAKKVQDLGFKKGVITTSNFTPNYYTLIKQGNIAILNMRSNSSSMQVNTVYTIYLPSDFVPKVKQEITLEGSGRFTESGITFTIPISATATVNTNGTIKYTPSFSANTGYVYFNNASWLLNVCPPVVETEYDQEQSGNDYYFVRLRNPFNASSVTIYYKKSSDVNYTSANASALGFVSLGSLIEGTSGTAYIEVNGYQSEIIEWSI